MMSKITLRALEIKHFFNLLLFLILLLGFKSVSAQNSETFATSSYIINMGVVPQTNNNALRPYGLIYDLLKNNNVPIKWVISQTISKDGPDYTYNGVMYKGVTFIISAMLRNSAENDIVVGNGMKVFNTGSPFSLNVNFDLKEIISWRSTKSCEVFEARLFYPATISSDNYKTKSPIAFGEYTNIICEELSGFNIA